LGNGAAGILTSKSFSTFYKLRQNLACSRRELLGKPSAIALAVTAAKLLPQLSIPQSYPSPKFNIGDLIAADWIDEFDNEVTDFGQVLGLRYLPEPESIFLANTWVYYVWWTHSSSGPASCYPCYDGEPTSGYDLRLV
jgi:hypothetical protein